MPQISDSVIAPKVTLSTKDNCSYDPLVFNKNNNNFTHPRGKLSDIANVLFVWGMIYDEERGVLLLLLLTMFVLLQRRYKVGVQSRFVVSGVWCCFVASADATEAG